MSARRRVGRTSVGHTLIELMIVVAIIGILAAIALPNYAEHVRRARRGVAKQTLLQAVQWMERYRTTNDTYAGATLPGGFARSPADGSRIDYQIAFVASTASPATRYLLVAVPSAMAGDVCGGMAIDQSGLARVQTDNAGAGGVSSGDAFDACWPR